MLLSNGPIGDALVTELEATGRDPLERDTAIVRTVSRGTQQVTSALTLAEAGRAIIRARATGRLTAEEGPGCYRTFP